VVAYNGIIFIPSIMKIVVLIQMLIVAKVLNVKGKGKAISLQALTDPEGSRRLKLPDFKTIDT
jgi:L-asparagine transporter-like permease